MKSNIVLYHPSGVLHFLGDYINLGFPGFWHLVIEQGKQCIYLNGVYPMQCIYVNGVYPVQCIYVLCKVSAVCCVV